MRIVFGVNDGGVPDALGHKLPDSIKNAVFLAEKDIVKMLLAKIRGKLSGDVVQVRTGRYLRSLRSSVEKTNAGVTAKVWTTDPVANILEHGGTIPPHEISPFLGRISGKDKRALHFLGTSGEVFAAVVHSPGAEIKPHSVFKSTYAEEKTEIKSRLNEAVSKATDVV